MCLRWYFAAFALSIQLVIGSISKHPILIIVSIDGFRYDYLDVFETMHLEQVKLSGVGVPYMRNQFVTRSLPNHHSLATGLFIESHGVVGNTFLDEEMGWLNGKINDPGYWNYSMDIIPLWTANELAGDGRYSGVMMWPGSNEPWGRAETLATYRRAYEENGTTEATVDQALSWIMNKEKPANLVMIYWNEPDHMAHDFGTKGRETAEQVELVDRLVGYMLGRLSSLGIRDRVNLMFAGDHGMMEQSPQNMIPHFGFMDNANESLYKLAQGSPVMQILPRNKSDTQRIFEAFLAQIGKYNFSVYLTSQLGEMKPDWHFAAPRRTAPIVAIAEPGFVFQDYWGIGLGHITGIHGYDPKIEKKMYPYFMATGPLFKVNATVEPFDNVDVYPFVCYILGLRPHGNNGSLKNMLPLLRDFNDAEYELKG